MLQPIKGRFEQTQKDLAADFKFTDPEQKQIDDDNRLLKSVGDSRTMTQDGKFIAPDGVTVVETPLHFIRTRNKNGGVDVICVVPAMALTGAMPPPGS